MHIEQYRLLNTIYNYDNQHIGIHIGLKDYTHTFVLKLKSSSQLYSAFKAWKNGPSILKIYCKFLKHHISQKHIQLRHPALLATSLSGLPTLSCILWTVLTTTCTFIILFLTWKCKQTIYLHPESYLIWGQGSHVGTCHCTNCTAYRKQQ